jgi:hypothetical protein
MQDSASPSRRRRARLASGELRARLKMYRGSEMLKVVWLQPHADHRMAGDECRPTDSRYGL